MRRLAIGFAMLSAAAVGLAVDARAARQPDELAKYILESLAQQPGLALTTIRKVECDARHCEIAYSRDDPNPRWADGSKLLDRLVRQSFQDGVFMILTAGSGTREVAPGAREHVIDFTYMLVDPPSDDPVRTAEQRAVCARAWLARATRAEAMKRPGVASEARDYAELELVAAAGCLGREAAERIAHTGEDEGPLRGDCMGARAFID